MSNEKKQESCPENKRKQQKIKQRQRRVLSNKRAEKTRLASEKNRAIANQLFQTIQHFFPDLYVLVKGNRRLQTKIRI